MGNIHNFSQTIPNSIISEPFSLGLIFYLRYQHYNLANNLEETFGFTGIFSEPFTATFLKMAELSYQETT